MRRTHAFPLLAVIALSPAAYSQDRQITPDSIRVEPLRPDAEGGWITLAGYLEIGSPAISRDGQWVALDGRKAGYNFSPGEIWIARRDGSELRKLTDGATPRWSPDGDRLIFMRSSREGGSDRPEPEVYVIDRDGTDEQRICEGRWPDWSPDGKRIVFSLGGTPGGGVRPFSRVYVAQADGSEPQLIADGDCASWSPDGTMIACCQADPAHPAPVIRVVQLEAGKQQIVGFGWFRPNWLPDGRHVAANGFTQRGQAMVKLSTERRAAPEEIFEQFERTSSPCYSADGRYAVFVAERPESNEERN